MKNIVSGEGRFINLKRFKIILRLILVAICIAYLVRFFAKNSETIQIAFRLDYKLLLAIIGLQPFFYLLQSWRFRVVMEKCTATKLPFWPWLKIYILARFLNTIFSQAGNVYRSTTLKRNFGIPHTSYIGGHASMTWLDTCMNLIMALVIVIIVKPGFQIGQFRAWKLLTILLIVFVPLPFLTEMFIGRFTFKNKLLSWIHQRFHQVVIISVNNLNDPAYLLKVFFIGVLIFIRTCLAFYIFFLCFDIEVSLPALAMFYAIFKLSSFIVLTPGNLGIQEVVWGILSESMGIGMAQGVLVSAFVRVVGTCSIIFLGFTLGGIDLIQNRKQYAIPDET